MRGGQQEEVEDGWIMSEHFVSTTVTIWVITFRRLNGMGMMGRVGRNMHRSCIFVGHSYKL